MPRTWKDITDQRFGKLIVLRPTIEPYENNGRLWMRGQAQWHCICDCGNTCIASAHALSQGRKTSCGCARTVGVIKHNQSPHKARTPEYRAWMGMKIRCTYKCDPRKWAYYGGRGITICERWLHDFNAFLEDVGPKPEPKQLYSLDRINNDGNYEPGNVRWATAKEQSANRRNTPKT